MKKSRKIFMIMIATLIVLSLSACSSDSKTPGSDASVNSADSNSNSNNVSDNNGSSDDNNIDIVSVMTPPNSNVLERGAGGYMIMTSTQSYENLVTFYESALKSIGAKETTCIKGPDTKEWGYAGKYGSDQTNILVVIAPWEDGLRIAVAYDKGRFSMSNLPPNSVLEGRSLRP
jgi:hypothetical protein